MLVTNVQHGLSGEPLSTRSIEELLYDKMTEMNLNMQKVFERLDKNEADTERQNNEITR
jgi:hypothetical protein